MKALLSAALALGLTASSMSPVIAQDFGIRVGPNGAGVEVGRDRDYDRRRGSEFRDRDFDRGRGAPVIVERRGRPDCRMVEVRRERRGETIITRERRCD